MPIQIVDNFDLNSPKPLDNRMVVGSQSFYTNKDNIPYKYPGMRIWDLDAGIPFYWTGTTFSSENSSAVSGSGTSNYLPLFILGNVVGNSVVYQDILGKIGINTSSPLYQFDVAGDLRATTLRGVGQFISNLNAGNITLGSLSLARLTNGVSGQILLAGPSQPQWSSPSSVSVGTASNVVITNDTASSTQYITFVDGTSGSRSVKVSSTKLQFTPSSGNFYVSGNVGIGVTPTSDKLTVSGTSVLSGNTTINGVGRINRTGINAFVVAYTSGQINFGMETSANTTEMKLYNPGASGTYFTTITQFSNYSFFGGNGRTYFNVNNEGDRLLTFGRNGANDQIRFYMDNSPSNVPVVGGKGVWIDYNLRVNGTLSKASGSFQIEHPLESKKNTHTLVHSFIEGPQADNIYRGKVVLSNGYCQINIDINSNMTEGTFVALNRDVQCFTTNETGWTPVKGKVVDNILTIESEDSNSTDTISWMVIGERRDKHMYETNWTDENGKVVVEPVKV